MLGDQRELKERLQMNDDSIPPTEGSDFFEGPVEYPPVPDSASLEVDERALPQATHALVNLEVPHIHQLWDTPENFDGHWACGPTSSAMVLAYYGLLEAHPIKVKVPGQGVRSSEFGWY
jgi:hypothetical protein